MGITFDFGQLVMDNDFAGMIKYMINGVPVDDETLAVDVIKEIGPFKDFLSHKHTLKHMKTQSKPKLIDRQIRENWESVTGGKDLYERALEEARQILETHKPKPLPENVRSTIRSIIEEAEEELGVAKKGKE